MASLQANVFEELNILKEKVSITGNNIKCLSRVWFVLANSKRLNYRINGLCKKDYREG